MKTKKPTPHKQGREEKRLLVLKRKKRLAKDALKALNKIRTTYDRSSNYRLHEAKVALQHFINHMP